VRYYQAFDAESEARFVAAKILEHRQDQYDLRAAVLYRTNSQSRVFEEAMRRAGLQYNIVGGFSFYERMEVRDIIAYLKLALNPNDSIALQRVINSPPRGIGKQTLDELTRRANDYGVSLWETIALVITSSPKVSARAPSALRSFRRIKKLSGRPIIEGLRVSLARKRPRAQRRPTPTPQSDIVKAAISIPATRTHSRPRRLTKPKRVWKTCRNWSTPPSTTTNKASKACASSSITPRSFPTPINTRATRRSR
jgi:hypothetical protein